MDVQYDDAISIQRRDLRMARAGAALLRHGAGGTKSRHQGHRQPGHLWLGGVKIGDTEFSTSLFPKEGRYLVPIKAAVRKKEDLQKGDTVDIQLDVGGKGGMLI
jgi:hypothetical protein